MKIKFDKTKSLREAVDTIKKTEITEITRILLYDDYIVFEVTPETNKINMER